MLRVPVDGTLAALATRHSAFLARTRLADPTLRPPPPLSAFDVAGYARADQPPLTEIAGFTLMKVAADTLRAFDPVTRGMAVAGMLRHLVRRAAERAGWDPARVNACVLGHGVHADGRLLLVPVPSIEPRGPGAQTVGPVRRVMLFSTAAGSRDTEWARRSLGGMGLVAEDTGEVQAVLAAAPRGDRVLARYLGESCCWATVTPLVLPGHDDRGGLRHRLQRAASTPQQEVLLARLSARREALVRKALSQSGLGDELAATAHIETRETGFLAGVRRASEFAVPSHLSEHPRLHVKLTWPRKVPGPLCLGRGRFSGVGLFAAAEG
jgi:CRISPR-associated protein Csb2